MEKIRPNAILTACFIWVCIAVMAALSALWPEQGLPIGDATLRWPTLAQVFRTSSNPDNPAPLVTEDVLVADSVSVAQEAADSVASMPVAAERPLVRLDTTAAPVRQEAGALVAFASALKHADAEQVRVVHYGDSQIEEDRITMVLREHLQALYGGGGVGLIPLHQTIPTRTLHQVLTMNGAVQTPSQGPRRYIVYGPRSMRREDRHYGPMGQVTLMDDGVCKGSEDISLFVEPMAPKKQGSEQYFSLIRLFATDSILCAVEGDSLRQTALLRVADSTRTCRLRLAGRGEVYALSLETERGVIVDNIPMRGSLGTVFTEIDREQLQGFYAETNTRLIIMQFGGNFIAQAKSEGSVYAAVRGLRQQVAYLKECAPQASFLFIGPSDMLINQDGQQESNPYVPLMDRSLSRMAEEEGIAYWSLYRAMGGTGSMVHWQEIGLAGSDGVHFTRSGAKRAGELLWKWLEPQLAETDEETHETQEALPE